MDTHYVSHLHIYIMDRHNSFLLIFVLRKAPQVFSFFCVHLYSAKLQWGEELLEVFASKVSTVLRGKRYNLWHNWIYFMKIEISAPHVKISPLKTPGSAWISTFPISLAQVWLQDIEIWSKRVILGLISRDFGSCSLIAPPCRVHMSDLWWILIIDSLEGGILREFAFPLHFQVVYRHTQVNLYLCKMSSKR